MRSLACTLAVLCGVLNAHAGVVYHDIPDLALSAHPGYSLDLNGDGQPDLFFNAINNCTTPDPTVLCFRRWEAFAVGESAVVSNPTYTIGLNAGDPIGPAGPYLSPVGAPSVLTEGDWYFDGSAWSSFGLTGPWSDTNASMFFGLKFKAADGTHYAWLRLVNDSASGNLVLTDFAYESSPDTPILAGAGLCPADFNGDGFLDIFDFSDFVTCFEGDVCPLGTSADFNADGFADIFDFSDFVEAFEKGC